MARAGHATQARKMGTPATARARTIAKTIAEAARVTQIASGTPASDRTACLR